MGSRCSVALIMTLTQNIFHRVLVRRTVSNVVSKESAFPTIKMAAYSASVTVTTQENPVVSLKIHIIILNGMRKRSDGANFATENKFQSFLSLVFYRPKKLQPAFPRWFSIQWRVHHQSRWRQTIPSVV